jgi:hypothetical protein
MSSEISDFSFLSEIHWNIARFPRSGVDYFCNWKLPSVRSGFPKKLLFLADSLFANVFLWSVLATNISQSPGRSAISIPSHSHWLGVALLTVIFLGLGILRAYWIPREGVVSSKLELSWMVLLFEFIQNTIVCLHGCILRLIGSSRYLIAWWRDGDDFS